MTCDDGFVGGCLEEVSKFGVGKMVFEFPVGNYVLSSIFYRSIQREFWDLNVIK